MKDKNKTTSYTLTLISIVSALFILFPIIWLVFSSVKPSSELFGYPLTLIAEDITFDHYVKVINNGFLTYIFNSLFLAVVGTAITLSISAMAGYALATYRNDVKKTNLIFGIFLLGTLIPAETMVISQFTVISFLGLYNNIWGVILPVVTTTTGIFMYRQFYLTTPLAFIESARIDGASEFHIFRKIMLPLSKATTITLTLFSFMWRWNDYILPLVVLARQDKFTIQIAIRNYIGFTGVDWSSILAAAVISIIPITILFMFLQKHIVGSDISSGDKG